MPLPTRILAAHLPDWPVQRLRLERRGDDREAPVAVSTVTHQVQRVTACCAAARRMGVLPGMRTSEAQSLAGAAGLVISPSDPIADRRALERLGAAADRFSPVAALEDAAAPSAVLFDVTGMWPLWGATPEQGERRLAESARGWFTGRRMVAQVAVAGTAALALGAARHDVLPEPGAGVAVIGVDCLRQAAARLPIASLRVDEPCLEKLVGLGVRRVGQLLELPRSGIPMRFGPELLRRLDQLLGRVAEPLVPLAPPAALQAEHRFESAVGNAEALDAVALLLLRRLAGQLARRRHGARRLRVVYTLDSGRARPAVELCLSRPTNAENELSELFLLRREGLRLPHPVTVITACVLESLHLEQRQQLLFEQRSDAAGFERDLLVSRLAARLGEQRVCRVRLHPSHDPLRACSLTPAVESPAFRGALPERLEQLRRLPLLMRRSRTSVRVESTPEGAPRSLKWRGQWRVTRCWGPERIETGWWRGRPIARDAYWVELEDGRWWWLLHDRRRDDWRLGGVLC